MPYVAQWYSYRRGATITIWQRLLWRGKSSEYVTGGRSVRLWGLHGERGALTYNGVWGQSPHRSPGIEPLLRGSGTKSPEATGVTKVSCTTGIHADRDECRSLPGRVSSDWVQEIPHTLLFESRLRRRLDRITRCHDANLLLQQVRFQHVLAFFFQIFENLSHRPCLYARQPNARMFRVVIRLHSRLHIKPSVFS